MRLSGYSSVLFEMEGKIGYKINSKTDISITTEVTEDGESIIKPNPNFIGEEEVEKKIQQGRKRVYEYLLEYYPKYAERYKRTNAKYLD